MSFIISLKSAWKNSLFIYNTYLEKIETTKNNFQHCTGNSHRNRLKIILLRTSTTDTKLYLSILDVPDY